MINKILFITLIICLTGCSGMNGKFDCNVDSGGRCASMSNINKLANQGAFNETARNKTNLALTNYYRDKNSKTNNTNLPIRSNESIQQIWIGPYEDTSGNYHESSSVYTVVKKGSWIGEPAKAVQEN